MSPQIIKTYDLTNTPVETSGDYHGCGWSVCVIKNGVPQLLKYLPDDIRAEEGLDLNDIDAHVLVEHDALDAPIEAYLGMVSCWEFNAMRDLIFDSEKAGDSDDD